MNSIQARSRFFPQSNISLTESKINYQQSDPHNLAYLKKEIKSNPFGNFQAQNERDFTTSYDITRNLPKKIMKPFFLQEEFDSPTLPPPQPMAKTVK